MSSQPSNANPEAIEENGPTVNAEANAETSAPSSDRELKSIIADILGLDPEHADSLTQDSGLFGHLPELDSMAVAGLLTEIEDRFDIVIDDEDVDGEMLETYGGLLAFVEAKLSER